MLASHPMYLLYDSFILKSALIIRFHIIYKFVHVLPRKACVEGFDVSVVNVKLITNLNVNSSVVSFSTFRGSSTSKLHIFK